MKISFQNVRTINDEKTLLLKQQLNKFDLLCMSELNKCYDFDKKNINDNEFQFHTDPSTTRIGFMASNTLNISTIETGLVLTQERVRVSDIAIQTFLYKIELKNRDIYVENVYVVPDATTDNLNKWCVITNAGSIFKRKASNPISFTPPGANARKIAAGVISEINFTIKMKGNNDIIKVITTETE